MWTHKGKKIGVCVFFEKNEKKKNTKKRAKKKKRKERGKKGGKRKAKSARGKEFEISNNPRWCVFQSNENEWLWTLSIGRVIFFKNLRGFSHLFTHKYLTHTHTQTTICSSRAFTLHTKWAWIPRWLLLPRRRARCFLALLLFLLRNLRRRFDRRPFPAKQRRHLLLLLLRRSSKRINNNNNSSWESPPLLCC